MSLQHALVIGLGISGKASCRLLQQMGYKVSAIDDNAIDVTIAGVEIQKESSLFSLSSFHLVVPSPGVSPSHPVYRLAEREGIPIKGEAQIALSQLSQKMIAVTGTNGKTTVTLLITHCLNASGYTAVSVGNIGNPLTSYALKPNPEEILVVELSSYQLETMEGESFDAAVILNITPDHLDRYCYLEEYAKAKWRIQGCLKKGRPLYVFEEAMDQFGQFVEKQNIITYSLNRPVAWNVFERYKKDKQDVEYCRDFQTMKNHDRENALAAWLLVRELGVSEEQFWEALSTFKKPSHRIEYISTIDGVHYYDDSKGTNLDAVVRAVSAMDGPVWLIAGGLDKGASYALWKQPFTGKVKKIFAIGQAQKKIAEEAKEFCLVEEVDSLEQAVRRASQEAGPNDNVLLSPGCSSFDMFRDYVHRGKEFQGLVRRLELERRGSS